MERPKLEDYKPKEMWCAEDMLEWYKEYIEKLEKYADTLEKQ